MGRDGIYHIELDLARTVALFNFAIHCWDIFCINCEKSKSDTQHVTYVFVASFVLTSLQPKKLQATMRECQLHRVARKLRPRKLRPQTP